MGSLVEHVNIRVRKPANLVRMKRCVLWRMVDVSMAVIRVTMEAGVARNVATTVETRRVTKTVDVVNMGVARSSTGTIHYVYKVE